MSIEEMKENLESLEGLVNEAMEHGINSQEFRNKKEQLKAIKRSISQLEKKEIPVPKEMQEIKISLVNEMENGNTPEGSVIEIYERLLDLVSNLGQACGRSPRHDLYLRAKEYKKQTTSLDVLSKAIVKALRDMGGSGREKEVISRVGEALEDTFTEVDKACPKGKNPIWHSNLRKAKKQLVEKGTLTPESKGRNLKLTR